MMKSGASGAFCRDVYFWARLWVALEPSFTKVSEGRSRTPYDIIRGKPSIYFRWVALESDQALLSYQESVLPLNQRPLSVF
jgi:hypothetical protein